jgi:hypothetical protein
MAAVMGLVGPQPELWMMGSWSRGLWTLPLVFDIMTMWQATWRAGGRYQCSDIDGVKVLVEAAILGKTSTAASLLGHSLEYPVGDTSRQLC